MGFSITKIAIYLTRNPGTLVRIETLDIPTLSVLKSLVATKDATLYLEEDKTAVGSEVYELIVDLTTDKLTLKFKTSDSVVVLFYSKLNEEYVFTHYSESFLAKVI